MKPIQNLPAAFRRKIALYIRNQKNQQTKQDGDFYDIIQKELDAPSDPAAEVHSQCGKRIPDQLIEPLHAQHLILQKLKYIHFDSISIKSNYFDVLCKAKRHRSWMARIVSIARKHHWLGKLASGYPTAAAKHTLSPQAPDNNGSIFPLGG